MPNDPTTPLGYVRLLITDTSVDDDDDRIFEDEEIQAFLDNNAGQPYRAAAVALETIATSEVLVQKVIKTLDVETDGSKVAAQLLARAATLRQQADDNIDDDDEDFAIAEFADPVFASRDHRFRDFLRGV
jgi:hypothetical protein